MASQPTLVRLEAEFDNSPEFIQSVATLLESGATPEFVCRYRRDETGDIDEARVNEFAERLHFLEDLETRKQAIRQQATERGQLTDSLEQTLAGCFDQDLLDDIYQSFRPKRRTPGVQAQEKGLGEIADKILASGLGEQTLQDLADATISEAKELPTREAVLEGVLHILAERFAADPVLRSKIRKELNNGNLNVKVVAPKAKGATRYKAYFEYAQPVRRVQGNDLLSIWRGEREGVLQVTLSLPLEKAVQLMAKHGGIDTSADPVLAQFLELVFQHTFEHLLLPACEADVRHQIKERVDRTTAQNLARNLRSQLMAPPLGAKKTLGIRASRNTVWLALLGEDGSVVEHKTLNLEPAEKRTEALKTIAELLENQQPKGIALPHGRHQDVTAQVVKEACAQVTTPLVVVSVDEAASAIHATSASARKEWPGLEVGIRTAISLANRLQDSMHEMLSLDPKALGLGHALGEVHQGLLSRLLDQTISSCVAKVGMDVNRASISHLARVPAMSRDLAKKIVDHRRKQGPFRTLQALQSDALLNELEFQQVAGFLRVVGGDQPLDASDIHPENYPLVDRIATAEGCGVGDLIGRRIHTPAAELTDDAFGILRVRDVMYALAHCGQDVRGQLTVVQNEGIRSMDDLRADLELRGRVTNLTEFGAFVDFGIHQDGLVHISQIPASRVRDPRRMIAVGEVITVYVLQVDPAKKRISLSMHKPRHLVEGRRPTLGERMQGGGPRRGRGREPTREPLSRAARAPDGRRRGGMRSGPRPRPKADAASNPLNTGGGGRGRDRDRGGGGGGRGGPPRVVTVESERPIEEVRGHKGELTSLSSLANLLGGAPAPQPAPAQPEPAEPQAQPREAPSSDATETAATEAPATSADGPAQAEPTGPTTAEPTTVDPTPAEPAPAESAPSESAPADAGTDPGPDPDRATEAS